MVVTESETEPSRRCCCGALFLRLRLLLLLPFLLVVIGVGMADAACGLLFGEGKAAAFHCAGGSGGSVVASANMTA